MAHTMKIVDADPFFEINPDSRAILKQTKNEDNLVQYDHNSERFTFSIPRIVEGHDMTECNKVVVEYLTINSDTKEQTKGTYAVKDLSVDADNAEKVVFTWLISQNVTQIAGVVSFAIRFSCVSDDGTIDYAWNTDIYKGVTVSNGIYNDDEIVEQYADVLEQWKQELFNESLEGVNNIKKAEAEAIKNIENAGGGGGNSDAPVYHGNVESFPENPKAGDFCYLVNDVGINGARYTGKVEELFTCFGYGSDFGMTGDRMYTAQIKFAPPAECISYADMGFGSEQMVEVYNKYGFAVGMIHVNNPQGYPSYILFESLGVSSKEDEITIYLGYYEDGKYPDTIKKYYENTMYCYKGDKWVEYSNHKNLRYRGTVDSVNDLPKNADVGDVYSIDALQLLDKFSNIFADMGDGSNYEISSTLYTKYPEYFIADLYSENKNVYVFNFDGTYVGYFYVEGAASGSSVAKLKNWNGNASDYISVYLCRKANSKGWQYIGHSVVWDGEKWRQL